MSEEINTNQTTYEQVPVQPLPIKSKTAAGLLFLFLGDIGVGNFYMGRVGLGILDLLFCWTMIPGLINFFRGLSILIGSRERFCQKYNVRVVD